LPGYERSTRNMPLIYGEPIESEPVVVTEGLLQILSRADQSADLAERPTEWESVPLRDEVLETLGAFAIGRQPATLLGALMRYPNLTMEEAAGSLGQDPTGYELRMDALVRYGLVEKAWIDEATVYRVATP
jgi:hypothetical protein